MTAPTPPVPVVVPAAAGGRILAVTLEVAVPAPTLRETSTDRVFSTLRAEIVGGLLEAGSLHSIYRLSERLEVSRTPVRDAVLRLADLGLVTIERNRGVRVRGVTVADVQQVFEVRLLLEVPAAARTAASAGADTVAALTAQLAAMDAAARADDEAGFNAHDRELHALLSSGLANPRLDEEVRRLRDSIQARGVSTIGRSRGMLDVAAEHAPIVAAVAAGDPEAAAAAMADHLLATAALLVAQVATEASPVDPGWPARARALIAGPSSAV